MLTAPETAGLLGLNLELVCCAESSFRRMLPDTTHVYHAKILDHVPMQCPQWLSDRNHHWLSTTEYCVSDQRFALINCIGVRTERLLALQYEEFLISCEHFDQCRSPCVASANSFTRHTLRSKWQCDMVTKAVMATRTYYNLIHAVTRGFLWENLEVAVDMLPHCVPLGEKRGEQHSLVVYWY